MNLLKRIAIGIGFASLLAAPLMLPTHAAAAPKAPKAAAAGARGASFAALPVSAINSITTLKDDQTAKIKEIQEKLLADRKAEPDKTKYPELNKKAGEDILAVLTEQQISDLKAAAPMLNALRQSRAIPLIVLGDLKLTADQKKQIADAATDMQAKVKALPKEERKTKMPELSADFKTKVQALLTAEQKATIEKAPKPGRRKAAKAV